MLGRCRDVDAKCRSGERLAISAVADVERIGTTSAWKVISPQWQCPSIFMRLVP